MNIQIVRRHSSKSRVDRSKAQQSIGILDAAVLQIEYAAETSPNDDDEMSKALENAIASIERLKGQIIRVNGGKNAGYTGSS